MSKPPPSKKLCQLSILSMLSKKDADCKDPLGKSTDNGCPTLPFEPKQGKDIDQSILPKTKMNSARTERCLLMAKAAEKRKMEDPTSPSGSRPPESPDMFSSPESPRMTWRNQPLDSLPSLSTSNMNVPPVARAPNHKILVQLPIPQQGDIKPFPSNYKDIWDDRHVRMPNSPCSLYPQSKHGEEPQLVERWFLICNAFKRPINTADDLEEAILSYNHRYKNKWKFFGLKTLIQEMCEEEQNSFFSIILPGIIKLALSIPEVVTTPPLLLQRNINASITMSQKQVACLLANAFLCTFPRRNARGSDNEYSSYPDINFNRLFFHKNPCALEKMKCLIHYFKEMILRGRNGLITFSRQFVDYCETPIFEKSDKLLPKLHVDSTGLIEEAQGLLQVDFANKYLGGGVLGLGCVQEEIRFVLCPELLITRLFAERLDKRESFIITGPEQFSEGKGYSSKFEWVGPYTDLTPQDQSRRKLCQVTAIDALHFNNKFPSSQFKPEFVRRELVKAFAGFQILEGSPGTPVAIATGNWGCGAFNGDPRLKSLIQIASAGEAGRDVAYFTFEDSKLCDQISEMHLYLSDKDITIGELVKILLQYGTKPGADGKDLYHYIRYIVSADHSDTDSGNSEERGLNVSQRHNDGSFEGVNSFHPCTNSRKNPAAINSRSTNQLEDQVQIDSSSKEIVKEEDFQNIFDCEKGLLIRNSPQTERKAPASLLGYLDEIDETLK